MGNTDRKGPEISEEWQGTSEDGESNVGNPSKVAVIGAGVAGLGESRLEHHENSSFCSIP